MLRFDVNEAVVVPEADTDRQHHEESEHQTGQCSCHCQTHGEPVQR